MIKCFVTLCLIANPQVCKPEMEITPVDHPVTSPMECARGAFGNFSGTEWYVARSASRLDGDGSDIVRTWVAGEKARLERLAPQIK